MKMNGEIRKNKCRFSKKGRWHKIQYLPCLQNGLIIVVGVVYIKQYPIIVTFNIAAEEDHVTKLILCN